MGTRVYNPKETLIAVKENLKELGESGSIPQDRATEMVEDLYWTFYDLDERGYFDEFLKEYQDDLSHVDAWDWAIYTDPPLLMRFTTETWPRFVEILRQEILEEEAARARIPKRRRRLS